jgi:hypothetical protein
MPKIIVEANPARDTDGERTFSERVVTQNLRSGHYNSQLLERLKWAVADAEAAEAEAGPGLEAIVGRPRVMDSLYFG